MGRAGAGALVACLAIALAGCGGDGGAEADSSAVRCDDAAFRGQDEELYVTKTAVANAMRGGGEPATLLRDLRRAHTALGEYIDAHPPCDPSLAKIEGIERDALAALVEAIAARSRGESAGAALATALARLTEAQQELVDSS